MSFGALTITLILKKKRHAKTLKETYRGIYLTIISAKLINKILANCIQQHNKKMVCHQQLGFMSKCQDDSTHKV